MTTTPIAVTGSTGRLGGRVATRLAAAGVAVAADELWRDYRHGSLWGLLMSVIASMGVERTDRGERMFLAMTQRHARQAIDLDALALLA